MEDKIIQQNYYDILIDGYEEDSDCISIEQIDYGEQIIVEKQHLPLFISKLAKFADGDDSAMMIKRFANSEEKWSDILKDFIILKRPTDETGK